MARARLARFSREERARAFMRLPSKPTPSRSEVERAANLAAGMGEFFCRRCNKHTGDPSREFFHWGNDHTAHQHKYPKLRSNTPMPPHPTKRLQTAWVNIPAKPATCKRAREASGAEGCLWCAAEREADAEEELVRRPLKRPKPTAAAPVFAAPASAPPPGSPPAVSPAAARGSTQSSPVLLTDEDAEEPPQGSPSPARSPRDTTAQRLFTTNLELQNCQRQSSRWHKNSCYVDAALNVIEYAGRWLLSDGSALPMPAPIEHNAYLSPPAVRRSHAAPMSSVRVDIGEPLKAWLGERDRLRNLAAPLPPGLLTAAVERLGQHRDDVRRAYHLSELKASSDAELQQQLDTAMGAYGTAGTVLLRLLQPASEQFLRVRVRARCPNPACSAWQREQPDFSAVGPAIELLDEALLNAGGRPILALVAKLAWHEPTRHEAACCTCTASSCFDLVPICSTANPRFVLLLLPDKPRKHTKRAYKLEPAVTHELVLNNVTVRCRLIAVLLYSGAARIEHYIADVFDQRDGVWLRFDGNAERGVGVPVRPPTGAVQHDGQEYFPVGLLYGSWTTEPVGGD